LIKSESKGKSIFLKLVRQLINASPAIYKDVISNKAYSTYLNQMNRTNDRSEERLSNRKLVWIQIILAVILAIALLAILFVGN